MIVNSVRYTDSNLSHAYYLLHSRNTSVQLNYTVLRSRTRKFSDPSKYEKALENVVHYMYLIRYSKIVYPNSKFCFGTTYLPSYLITNGSTCHCFPANVDRFSFLFDITSDEFISVVKVDVRHGEAEFPSSSPSL